MPQLEDLPGLFDSLDIDMTRADIAGDILAETPHVSAAAAEQGLEINREALRRPETLRFISFGSGSSGNCAYIGCEDGGLLIDAGVDYHIVEKGMRDNGIDPKSIAGIILTHDHSDHVGSAYTILRANRHMLLYCTPRCLTGILRRHNISRRIKDYHKAIYKEFEFQAGGFTVIPFETSHDGTDNVGFAIRRGDKVFVVATDMGVITERADHYMQTANYLMLESNYDDHMLTVGRYPEYLKARIRGEKGHLDNAVSAEYVARTYRKELTHLFLCHLSADNNTPDIALATMQQALRAAGVSAGTDNASPALKSADIQVVALPRYDASPLYILTGR